MHLYQSKILPIIFAIMTSWSFSAQALCLGYSWLTELHSKELGISCKAAQKQIEDLTKTINKALMSDRDVQLVSIGELKVTKGSGKNPNQRSLLFKVDKTLSARLNNARK